MISKTHWIIMGLAIAAGSIFWGYVATAADLLPWFVPTFIAVGFCGIAFAWHRMQPRS